MSANSEHRLGGTKYSTENTASAAANLIWGAERHFGDALGRAESVARSTLNQAVSWFGGLMKRPVCSNHFGLAFFGSGLVMTCAVLGLFFCVHDCGTLARALF